MQDVAGVQPVRLRGLSGILGGDDDDDMPPGPPGTEDDDDNEPPEPPGVGGDGLIISSTSYLMWGMQRCI